MTLPASVASAASTAALLMTAEAHERAAGVLNRRNPRAAVRHREQAAVLRTRAAALPLALPA